MLLAASHAWVLGACLEGELLSYYTGLPLKYFKFDTEIYIYSAPNNSNEPFTFFVWADRAVLGSTETAQQKLKCATFEASYFMFS